MQMMNLGKTGLKVSRLCLGCMTYGTPAWRDWVLDEAASRPFFVKALEAGINFFDTADVYSLGVSEEVTGRALRELAKRDDVVVATKVFSTMSDKPNHGGLSRKWIMQAIDDSLRRLGMDYVDLYQIHRYDPETPIEETMEALHDVVKAGKARYIGASSMYAWQFAQMQHTAEKHGWTQFVSMQNHYNLVYREEEREMIPFCMDTGVGLIPWSPLARGFLAGKRTREAPATTRAKSDDYAHRYYYMDSDYDVVDAVAALAEAHGVKPIQIALAWVLHRPGVTAPIIGVSKMPQFDELLGALDIQLSPEDMGSLESPYRPHVILGH
ncbi:MAG: aldo/keto reductase [Chloroflexi bacterium]|nr:aldo/keto reductase [Chloroflexota bacterium]